MIRECSSKLNINSYLIIQKLLGGGTQASIDLLKLIYYGNDTTGRYVNPYTKDEVIDDLYGVNVFSFDYIPNVQSDTKTIVNVYFDNIKSTNQGLMEESSLYIDILVHRNVEMIVVPYDYKGKKVNIIGSRTKEMFSKFKMLLDDSRDFDFLTSLKFYQSLPLGIQDKYTGMRIIFKATNMR